MIVLIPSLKGVILRCDGCCLKGVILRCDDSTNSRVSRCDDSTNS